jgi:hypothetical protein
MDRGLSGRGAEWSNDDIGASLGEVGLEHLFDRLDDIGRA